MRVQKDTKFNINSVKIIIMLILTKLMGYNKLWGGGFKLNRKRLVNITELFQIHLYVNSGKLEMNGFNVKIKGN